MSSSTIRLIFQQLSSDNVRTIQKTPTKTLPRKLLSVFALCLIVLTLVSCANQDRYMETHEISHLRIVFLDDQSLQDLWETKTGEPGIQFQPWLRGDLASVKMVRGFYDFSTETLYCPKWNYEVCGHELHHAALGHFHPND